MLKSKDKAPDVFVNSCVIMRFGDKLFYEGCPFCSKKVVNPGSKGVCQKCKKEFSEPERIYLFTLSVSDGTDGLWVTVFGNLGETILGILLLSSFNNI